MTWTIEPHGDGYALYSGRDKGDEYGCFATHGMNLVYLSEPDQNWPRVKPLIEAAPDMLAAIETLITDSAWIDTDDEFQTLEVPLDVITKLIDAVEKARGEK